NCWPGLRHTALFLIGKATAPTCCSAVLIWFTGRTSHISTGLRAQRFGERIPTFWIIAGISGYCCPLVFKQLTSRPCQRCHLLRRPQRQRFSQPHPTLPG